MKYFIGCFLWSMMCMSALVANAQSACDKLFANGVKCQQTMTISSQKNAIGYFEKAKICYDSQAKKDLCDQQIKSCRNIITQLTRTEEAKKKESQTRKPEENDRNKAKNDLKPVKKNGEIKLSLDRTYIKFKGKGNEFQKVKVTCNYPDWEITKMPEWVNCSKNENNEIVIEVEKNPNDVERSAQLEVTCGDEVTTLTIIQEKFKKYILF